MKGKKTSKYFGVSRKSQGYRRSKSALEEKWIGQVYFDGIKKSRIFDAERDAAKWVDIQRIRHGADPINILTKIKK